jgi:hypothetical protein
MIHIENQFIAQQVMTNFMESIRHCECLPFNRGIILFSVVEHP